jgi:hypothetical protein
MITTGFPIFNATVGRIFYAMLENYFRTQANTKSLKINARTRKLHIYLLETQEMPMKWKTLLKHWDQINL